jgi:hypothetical protein
MSILLKPVTTQFLVTPRTYPVLLLLITMYQSFPCFR